MAIEEIEVVAEQADPRDGSVQVTVITVDDTLPASADVAMAVQRAPGVVVKRLGGLGDWSSVSIRGSTARQVEVFLDGLPLNPEGGEAVNLSELPLSAFSSVEVYRGAAPLTLDTTASGGAVNLVTGAAAGARGAISAGSWGTARMNVVGSGRAPVGEVFASVDGLVTDGGFTYFSDGGTRGESSDDTTIERSNNDTEQLSALLRWRLGDSELGLSVFDAWVHRREGVPGFTFAPLRSVRYEVDRHLPVLEGHGVVGATRIEGRAWGTTHREVRLDPLGELGPPGEVATDTGSLGARAQIETAPMPWLQLTNVTSIRSDQLSGDSVRGVARVGAEGVLHTDVVAASVALRSLYTSGQGWWLPRTGLRVAKGAWSVKGGIGRSVRIPDVTELFGDRGTQIGNPDLLAERALGGDVSAALQGSGGGVELGGFVTRSDDRIVWERNAQGLMRPANVERARLLGLEGAGHLERGWLELQTTLTITRAEDRREDIAYRGNQLPGIPWFEGWHRTGVRGEVWTVAHDLSLTAGTYDDPTNFTQQAPRFLQGATLAIHDIPNVWSVAVDVRNLANVRTQQVPRDPLVEDGIRVDQPVSDFVGMPLAGRTWMISLRARR